MSMIGGGWFNVAVCFLTLVWGRRSKFFYYLAVLCLDQGLTGLLRLAYHQPRPFWEDKLNVFKAYDCTQGFGAPDANASSAVVISIVLILDVFHGRSFDYNNVYYKSHYTYLFACLVAFTWSVH